jgi:tRNA-uridine 2-sulfurtransferase
MRAAVAVSGGADSLLALLLLREEASEAVAVHADFLGHGREASAPLQSLLRTLGIPFHWIDLSREFHRLVVQPFIDEYSKGRTPNPCAQCNKSVKFGLLHDWAMDGGFDTLATGHYARVLDDGSGPGLYRGMDPAKDQSYFLSLVPAPRIGSVRLPLGTWRKQDVREELRRMGISPPLPRESQEVCFVPDDDYRRFLHAHCPALSGPGAVEDRDGKVLGRHQGLWRHTIGQRRGMGIAYDRPLYALDKDHERNVLVVGTKEELMSAGLSADSVNFMKPHTEWPKELLVQTVYRQKAKPARVMAEGRRMRVTFVEPQPRACPGQIAAVYSPQGQVLAGGVITGGLDR